MTWRAGSLLAWLASADTIRKYIQAMNDMEDGREGDLMPAITSIYEYARSPRPASTHLSLMATTRETKYYYIIHAAQGAQLTPEVTRSAHPPATLPGLGWV